MYRINFTTLSLLLVLGMNGLMSEPTKNADGSIKGLYEYLLQREYAAPVSYADHQIKRKAVRSPSLRLRFGRRSDPDMPVQPEAGSLSRRSIPDDKPDVEVVHRRSILNDAADDDSSASNNVFVRRSPETPRKPSCRLRWGRSPNSECPPKSR